MYLSSGEWEEAELGLISLDRLKLQFPHPQWRVTGQSYKAGEEVHSKGWSTRCYILKGKLGITVGEVTVVLSSGQWIDIPEGLHIAQTDEGCEFAYVWRLPV